MTRILRKDESYTFSKYFDLAFDAEDILADLGFRLSRRTLLDLPKSSAEIHRLDDLFDTILDGIRYANPSNEQGRREFLVAPVIRAACKQTQRNVRIEYPIAVDQWLKGTLDYYFRDLLVIEAKRDNLDNGFTQLAVEMIAIDRWTDSTAPILYGAVTTGADWRFGTLDRESKLVTQDLKLYRVPEGLEDLMRVLVGILENKEE